MTDHHRATWPNCAVCGQPVTTETATLSVNGNKALKHHTAEQEHDRQHPGPSFSDTADWLFNAPPVANWVVTHRDHVPDGSDYRLEGPQIDTPGKALYWTVHFMRTKNWLASTDWPEVLEELGLVDPSAGI